MTAMRGGMRRRATLGSSIVGGGLAKTATLVDSFDALSGSWGATTGVILEGGRCRFAATAAYPHIEWTTHLDLVGSSIYGQFWPDDVGNTRELTWQLRDNGGTVNQITFGKSGNSLVLSYDAASAFVNGAFPTYSAIDHSWWRLRESAGTVYWDTAPDGVTWTNRFSIASSWTPNNITVHIEAGYYGTEVEPFYVYVDNINTLVSTPLSISKFELGYTATQNSFDTWGDATAVALGNTLVNEAMGWRNQHMVSFGTGPLEETIGTVDYGDLDYRINTVMASASHVNITLAMAPWWMSPTGTSGTTDYALINTVAPTPAHRAEFAALAAGVAARYPKVRTFHMWNEFKGLWNDALNRPDYEGYVDLYNQTWAAVKAVRPDAKIGGPYTVMLQSGGTQSNPSTELAGPWGAADQRTIDSIKYWLANKTGADFILFDGGNMVVDNIQLVSPFAAAKQIMAATMTWLRGLNPTTYPGCDTLPVVWAEYYMWGDHWNNTQPSHAQTVATWTVGAIATIKAGYSRSFIWEAQGDNNGDLAPYSPIAVVKNTLVSGGGTATELQPVAKILYEHFSVGAPIYAPTQTNANIDVIGTTNKALLVNMTGSSQTTAGFSPSQTLSAWEVRLVTWAP